MDRITENIRNILQNGGVGVLPTDTIYGIVGSALNPQAVERTYKLRRRNPKKPMVILIGSLGDLRRFDIRPDRATAKILKKVWPGKVSVILPLNVKGHVSIVKSFHYLHRGTRTLAFRLPRPKWLRELLQKTGPLVAPSANWEGESPAKTIREAKKYFEKRVDFYLDAGRIDVSPSMLVKIEKGKIIVLRKSL